MLDSASLNAARYSVKNGVTQSHPPAPTQARRRKTGDAVSGCGLWYMIQVANKSNRRSPRKNGHLASFGTMGSGITRLLHDPSINGEKSFRLQNGERIEREQTVQNSHSLIARSAD